MGERLQRLPRRLDRLVRNKQEDRKVYLWGESMSALDVVLSLTVIASAIVVVWSAVLITHRDLVDLLGGNDD